MENQEKQKMINSLIEKELNGGVLDSQSERYELIARSLQMHRSLQSTLGMFVLDYLAFHEYIQSDENLRRRFYDGRNEWIGEFVSMIADKILLNPYHKEKIEAAINATEMDFFRDNQWRGISCEKIKAEFDKEK